MTAADEGHLDGSALQPDRERRRIRRRRWWLFAATTLGLLLCIQPLFSGGDDDSSPSSRPSDTVPDSRWSMGAAEPTVGSVLPSAPPTTAPEPEPTLAAPRPTPTRPASASRTPGPVLLGPSGKAGVADLAEEYCVDHGNGALAGPRADGRWQCVKLLLFVRIVDMDVACADTYGKGAYAQTADPDDAYAWRCYRR
ncbi:hypothetical protein [Catellatospora sichuanensis]|uniref:hypothetical protein n=1 Tax=Catellatospora sichuanensis TaxID=1969805 RepID=UPI00118201E8|nr:hypothetical protein [Catellatospora sichuanensis]